MAICIAMHHFQQTLSIGMDVFDFYGGTINFALCVEMFFIISGFLSMVSIESARRTSFDSYMIQKAKRLYPITSLSVMVLLIFNLFFYFTGVNVAGGLKLDLYKILNSFLLTFSGGSVRCGRGINNPLWYVCVLLICYILFWIIVHLEKKHGFKILYSAIIICTIGVGIYSYKFDLPFLNENISRGYSCFFLGVILFKIHETFDREKLYLISWFVFMISCLLGYIDYSSFFEYEWGSMTFVLFPSLLFVFLSMEKIFPEKISAALSGSSFEIYVWHPVFIHLVKLLIDHGFLNDPLLTMIVYILSLVLFGLFMYIFMEKKIISKSVDLFESLLCKKEEK